MYKLDYIFADVNDIRQNTLYDFDFKQGMYIAVYIKAPFKIKVTVKQQDYLKIDSNTLVDLIAKKFDELILNEYTTVTWTDMRKDEPTC